MAAQAGLTANQNFFVGGQFLQALAQCIQRNVQRIRVFAMKTPLLCAADVQ
ncbi:hypothetical protein [Dickeya dianthicola]|uniref:hypothetical protein n=1 Tax=Dickeya dianthicola TaxID=204039 RepID=UPI001BDE9BE4|nr:hypothetical protein [Dickeya dianthicola]MBT1430387.1 hypothetical protein [Dickeya dianthicola]